MTMIHNLDLLENEEDQNMNQNFTKKAIPSDNETFMNILKQKSLIYYSVYIFLIVGASIYFLYNIYYTASSLQFMITNGTVFMNMVTEDITMMIAIKEKKID